VNTSASDTLSPVKGDARVNLPGLTPETYQTLLAFTVAAEAELDPVIAGLVKVRVSQMNGCPFCLGLHSALACNAGETEERLSELYHWRESSAFTERERAALALAEAVTVLADGDGSDDVYHRAAEYLDDIELAHLLWCIAGINAWTRLGISTRMGQSG
jgi:AhpD family alkylhydroperoxidase